MRRMPRKQSGSRLGVEWMLRSLLGLILGARRDGPMGPCNGACGGVHVNMCTHGAAVHWISNLKVI